MSFKGEKVVTLHLSVFMTYSFHLQFKMDHLPSQL